MLLLRYSILGLIAIQYGKLKQTIKIQLPQPISLFGYHYEISIDTIVKINLNLILNNFVNPYI